MVKLGECTTLKALPFAEQDPSLSFKWSRDGSITGFSNEFKVEKVTLDKCNCYYICQISKNEKLLIIIYYLLKIDRKLGHQ